VRRPKEHPRTITFRILATVSLDHNQWETAMDAVNLRLFGDTAVNEQGPDGILVSKPMPPGLEERLEVVHKSLRRSRVVEIDATLDIDKGTWSHVLAPRG
jgi:hypothetical protein